jgi:hypothetical protein
MRLCRLFGEARCAGLETRTTAGPETGATVGWIGFVVSRPVGSEKSTGWGTGVLWRNDQEGCWIRRRNSRFPDGNDRKKSKGKSESFACGSVVLERK